MVHFFLILNLTEYFQTHWEHQQIKDNNGVSTFSIQGNVVIEIRGLKEGFWELFEAFHDHSECFVKDLSYGVFLLNEFFDFLRINIFHFASIDCKKNDGKYFVKWHNDFVSIVGVSLVHD